MATVLDYWPAWLIVYTLFCYVMSERSNSNWWTWVFGTPVFAMSAYVCWGIVRSFF